MCHVAGRRCSDVERSTVGLQCNIVIANRTCNHWLHGWMGRAPNNHLPKRGADGFGHVGPWCWAVVAPSGLHAEFPGEHRQRLQSRGFCSISSLWLWHVQRRQSKHMMVCHQCESLSAGAQLPNIDAGWVKWRMIADRTECTASFTHSTCLLNCTKVLRATETVNRDS